MNVLSLFDGMSCGQIALDRLGVKVDKYYASEIDKFAIEITKKNFPNTIHIGDVTKVSAKDLPEIDLILAGSPCQGFSFAGKQLAFDDPRSALFFEFTRLLKEIKPKYFLLENVKMKKEFLQIITEQVSACYPEYNDGKSLFGGLIEPILINSSLLSAQNRQRWYWTNIPNVQQPKEKGLVLADVLDESAEWGDAPQYLKNKLDGKPRGNRVKEEQDKANCLTASMWKGQIQSFVKKPKSEFEQQLSKMTTSDGKAYCLTATYNAAEPKNSMERSQRSMIPVRADQELPNGISLIYNNEGKSLKPERVGTHIEQVKLRKHEVDVEGLQKLLRESKRLSKKTNKIIADQTDVQVTKVEHWFRTDSSFAIPSEDVWQKLKEVLDITTDEFDKPIMEFEYKDNTFESTQRVYGDHGKSPTLTASNADQLIQTSNSPIRIGTAVDVSGHDMNRRVYHPNGKSPTVVTASGGNTTPKVIVKTYREGRTAEAKLIRKEYRKETGKDYTPFRGKELFEREDNKVGTVTPSLNNDHVISLTKDTSEDMYWRKITPIEAERLQTVPDNYTEGVSTTQRFRMLGNGWTVDVICHILKNADFCKE